MASVNKSPSNFPADLLVLLVGPLIGLPVASAGLSALWFAGLAREGGFVGFATAVGLACAGVVLLFLARLPLYRQGRFSQFGPRGLDPGHRRLYRRAWLLVLTGMGLFGLVIISG